MYYTKFGKIPKGKYSVIYADPPWTYNDKMTGHSFSLDHEYVTQDLDWIKSLDVRGISAKNAVLFMWGVSPQTPEAFEVMQAWGFRFKTLPFVWSKETATGKDVVNLGRWTMGNVELCWLGVKGPKPPQRVVRNIRQLVRAERTTHSRKPDDVRTRIDTLMGEVPRIELFARGSNPGWDQFGDTPVFNPDDE